MNEPETRSNVLIPAAIVAAGVIVALAVVYTGGGFRARPNSPGAAQAGVASGEVALAELADNDPALGNPEAAVTIIEFSDFQCPFCRSFWRDTLPQISERYIKTGKVRFIYRDFPLSIHEMAETYAQAAECANEQGKFWPMHDKIFAEQEARGRGTISGFSAADVKRWAREIGLDGGAFDACLDSEKYADEVAADFRAGQAAGASGTPAFIINL